MNTTTAHDTTIHALYLAYYGRPADPAGLAFWADQLARADGDIHAIADAFATSQEASHRFGEDSIAERVTAIYQQLFNRAPDAAGLAYWTDTVAQGKLTLADLALDILHGAQASDHDVVVLRRQAAEQFTAGVEASGSAYAGYAGIEAAQVFLRAVTAGASADDLAALVESGIGFVDVATRTPQVVEALASGGALVALFDTPRGSADPVALLRTLADTGAVAAGNPDTLDSLLRGGGMAQVLKVMPAAATLRDVVDALAHGGLPAAVEVVYPTAPVAGAPHPLPHPVPHPVEPVPVPVPVPEDSDGLPPVQQPVPTQPEEPPVTPQPEEPPVTPQPEEPPVTPQPEEPPVTPQPEEPPVTPQPEEPPVTPQPETPPVTPPSNPPVPTEATLTSIQLDLLANAAAVTLNTSEGGLATLANAATLTLDHGAERVWAPVFYDAEDNPTNGNPALHAGVLAFDSDLPLGVYRLGWENDTFGTATGYLKAGSVMFAGGREATNEGVFQQEGVEVAEYHVVGHLDNGEEADPNFPPSEGDILEAADANVNQLFVSDGTHARVATGGGMDVVINQPYAGVDLVYDVFDASAQDLVFGFAHLESLVVLQGAAANEIDEGWGGDDRYPDGVIQWWHGGVAQPDNSAEAIAVTVHGAITGGPGHAAENAATLNAVLDVSSVTLGDDLLILAGDGMNAALFYYADRDLNQHIDGGDLVMVAMFADSRITENDIRLVGSTVIGVEF